MKSFYTQLPLPLSKEEIHECFEKYRLGDLNARKKIINHNIRLVISEVKRKFSNTMYEENELISSGLLGLVKAVDTFDISRNLLFATYAVKCIDNEILMFMRNGKKWINDYSLEATINTDFDGKELKLEDVISDDSCDLVLDYEKKEDYKIVRKIVEELPERERLIIMMYFGFIDNKLYNQEEISHKLNISQSYISRLIKKILNKIKEKFENDNIESFNENHDKETDIITDIEQNKGILNGIGDKKMKKRLKNIYEYFNNYSREEIDLMLLKLSDDEKELIKLRYGDNLDIPVTSENWGKEQNSLFYGSLVPKMKRLLVNPNNKRKPYERKNPSVDRQLGVPKEEKNSLELENSLEENVQLLANLRTPILNEILKKLSYKEAIISCLKLGYVDDKYYSNESICRFLEIDESEVNEILKKVLLLYKEEINNYINCAIDIVDNQNDKVYKKKNV